MPTQRSQAAIWVVIKEVIKKVIVAIDLAIQKQQNKVIWLQNAQKKLENTMSKLKLNEISGWMEKQRKIYKEYFEELQKVKQIISIYYRIKEIISYQENIIKEYRRAYSLFKRDGHFNADEIIYMGKVYDGMLIESSKNIDLLDLVIKSFVTQMSDAKRIEVINTAAENITHIYNDLRDFNNQNIILSLQRSRDQKDINTIMALYEIK
jgi:hypothetical protein